MEQNESTISYWTEKRLLRGLANKVDAVKRAIDDLDDMFCDIDNNKMIEETMDYRVLRCQLSNLILTTSTQIEECAEHVRESGMLKDEEGDLPDRVNIEYVGGGDYEETAE